MSFEIAMLALVLGLALASVLVVRATRLSRQPAPVRVRVDDRRARPMRPYDAPRCGRIDD